MEKIDDIEFGIILPKYDNDGYKIDPDEFFKIAKELSKRFGGVTIYPSVVGCWINDETKELICEENTLMTSVRDTEQLKNKGLPVEKTLEEDRKFMSELGERLGKRFGQWSITELTGKREIEFFKGVPKRRLPRSMIHRMKENEAFRRLL